jgi:putative transposase
MARRSRLDVPGVAQHIIQRGVDRGVCFCDDLDRAFYLATLSEVARERDCAVHAYVLMTNHVHLLVTSGRSGGLSRFMQSIGRRYVRWFNDRHGRTGTLWEGRFRSCLVDTERYVLSCYRYIEMNPVRARMIRDPLEYRWSSAEGNGGSFEDPLLTPHETYAALSSDSATRRRRYRALLLEALGQEEMASIRAHVNQGAAYGSDRFQRQIEALTGQTPRFRAQGRPRKPH